MNWRQKKGLCVVSGHESRYDVAYQEQVKRLHDGAIGDIVAIQSMFLRPPYSTVARDPQLSEMEYQFSNWYHFRWLSGDDVTQSLVHNLDRMRLGPARRESAVVLWPGRTLHVVWRSVW